MVPNETSHGRPQVARLFNQLPHVSWLDNENSGNGHYESGRPDAFVDLAGALAYVEVKGRAYSIYLGNPLNPDDKDGWKVNQRNWYTQVCNKTGTPYWLAVWSYPELEPKRVYQEHAWLFLVRPDDWLRAEAHIFPKRTIRLETLKKVWARLELEWEHGIWNIPYQHPFWDSLPEACAKRILFDKLEPV